MTWTTYVTSAKEVSYLGWQELGELLTLKKSISEPYAPGTCTLAADAADAQSEAFSHTQEVAELETGRAWAWKKVGSYTNL